MPEEGTQFSLDAIGLSSGLGEPFPRGPNPDIWSSPGQTFDQSSETWRALCRVLTLCNRAAFKSGQDAVPVPKVRDRGIPEGDVWNLRFQSSHWILLTAHRDRRRVRDCAAQVLGADLGQRHGLPGPLPQSLRDPLQLHQQVPGALRSEPYSQQATPTVVNNCGQFIS